MAEVELARLMQSVGDCSEEQRDAIRGMARRSSEATLSRIRESIAGGTVKDRPRYVLAALRQELEK